MISDGPQLLFILLLLLIYRGSRTYVNDYKGTGSLLLVDTCANVHELMIVEQVMKVNHDETAEDKGGNVSQVKLNKTRLTASNGLFLLILKQKNQC